MKLFTKYNRINLLSTIIIFLLGCAAFTILLRYVIINQIDQDLNIEKNEIETYIHKFNRLPSVIEVRDQYTSYKLVKEPVKLKHEFFNEIAFDAIEKEKELRRSIGFNVTTGGIIYFVTVSKSLEGTDDLIQAILLITVLLISLILTASFIANRFVLKKLWKPFYTTIQEMRSFKLNESQQLNINTSAIEEFDYLNLTLTETLNKAQQDYQLLKEFTENASHELQTPLAVIRSKLDLLIQNEHLSKNESEAIKSAYGALQNLNKMNKSLLLLAKIENRQFSEADTIDLQILLKEKINEFSELWKIRNIKLSLKEEKSIIIGNTYMLNILLNNFLSNATKHNYDDGFITIVLTQSLLQISNSGFEEPLDKTRLFRRFSSQVNSENHFGLGLSINKQICEVFDYKFDYHFSEPDIHTFNIKW